MEWFSAGAKYRRRQLLNFAGSHQQQTGIIWGKKEPGCVICTSGGRHSKSIGYADGPAPDGIWHYFGQGGKGDQSEETFANRLLSEGQRTVLLFITREPTAVESRNQGDYAKWYQYVGAFHVVGRDVVIPSTGPRKGNRLVRFSLVPVLDQLSNETSSDTNTMDLGMLRERALNDYQPTANHLSLSSYRERSASIRRYALARAAGSCEHCRSKAPFTGADGRPYLEVHHILRLADDGPDLPTNVIALCPNCHRAAHFANDRALLHEQLLSVAKSLERLVDQGNRKNSSDKS